MFMLSLIIQLIFVTAALLAPLTSTAAESFRVPVLLYHRFGATVADSMTTTTPVFEAQMKYLHDNGYKVIPLRQLIDHYSGKAPTPAPKSVVICLLYTSPSPRD